jgi:phospholipase C
MNGFDVTLTGPNGEGPAATCTYTYQYVNPNDIAPYWDLAQQYALADNAFQSQGSSSFTAHQDLIAAGTSYNQKVSGSGYTDSVIDNPSGFPWGCDSPPGATTALIATDGLYLQGKGPFPCFPVESSEQYSTLRDLLDAKGVSWKFYGEKIKSPPGIWTAFDAIKAVRYGKEWGTNVVFQDKKIFTDLKGGHLPSVSWVVPDALNSDHPAEHSDTGPSWVASVVNAVGKSKYWKSSAVIVVWDDWGGFFDHAPPPFYDGQGGLGFRIPLIIVSPYAQAHVEHTQYETTSILRFIEDNWNLGTLGKLDQRATSIGNAFDFKLAPRKFKVIPAKYPFAYFLHQKPSGLPPDSE